MKVHGKKALVTGAASGIGLALARELSTRGAEVIFADLSLEEAEQAAKTTGGGAIAFDVSDTEAVERAAAQVWDKQGGVDIVFANAGVMANAPLLEGSAEVFDWIYGVNLRGVWATCRAFANRMIAEGRPGHLVLTGSEHSLGRQHLGAGFYTASKHAVLGLADVLRGETPDTIGVSVFCPGLVESRLHESARFGVAPAPSAQAQAVVAEVMRRGMSAEEAARRAVDGLERGEFLIVTHANAYAAAERRFAEIKAAFDAQAPATGDVSEFEVNAVVARVLREMQGPS